MTPSRGAQPFAALRHVWWGVSVEDRRYGLPRIDHLRRAPAGLRFLSIEPLLEDLGSLDLSGIDWVILGGESGLAARPMDPSRVRSVQRQCADARVPFFFHQWGGARRGGRVLDRRTYDEFPVSALATAPVPSRADGRRSFERCASMNRAGGDRLVQIRRPRRAA